MTVEESELKKSHVFQSKVMEKSPMGVSGKGVYITVEDPVKKTKKTYIDGSTGAAVGSLGHGDADILKAFAEVQDGSCVYSFPSSVCNYNAEALAKFICDHSNGAFTSALFTGSGSESNENAMRIARQYHLERNEPQRLKFISRNQSYHGYTLGAMSIGSTIRFQDFREIALPKENTPKVSEVNTFRHVKDGETLEEYKDRLLKEVEETFIAAGPETVAAFICETVSGSTLGCQTPPPGYLEGCRKIAHKYGALFMLDEVMCGLGRCGTYHAWEQFLPEGQSPDIQTIGKTLGSGYVTIAGVLISPKVQETIANGSGYIIGAQTYHSHSLNCKIALAVQSKLFELGLIDNSKEVGEYLAKRLQEEIGDHKYVGCFKGAGLFRGVEFVKNKTTKECFDPSLGFYAKFGAKCLENGLTVMAGNFTADGTQGDHFLLAPAYILDNETADQMVKIIATSLDQVVEDLKL